MNATDLLVPFAGLVILATLLTGKSRWPEWKLQYFYPWLAVLSAVLALAFLNSYLSYEQFSQWAFLNKLCGWAVLMGIMGIGGWIAANAAQRDIELFVKIFLYFFLAVLTYQLSIIVVQSYQWSRSWLEYNRYASFPIAGLMANRNAYGLLFIAALSLSTCFYFSKETVLRPFYSYALFFSMPLFMIFNGSRAVFMALCVIVPFMLISNWKKDGKSLHLLLSLALGALFVVGVYHNKPEELTLFQMKQYEVLLDAGETIQQGPATLSDIGQKVTYPGDSMRLTILEDSLEMVRNHPIIGSGLGSVFFYQQEKHGHMINLIDCTPLWLLVETGAVGLILFALFYMDSVRSVYRSFMEGEGFSKTFRLSLLYIVFAFSLMCLFHEIMYTRFIWFFIGLGLALPIRTRHPE